jgi:hypothetical protein
MNLTYRERLGSEILNELYLATGETTELIERLMDKQYGQDLLGL